MSESKKIQDALRKRSGSHDTSASLASNNNGNLDSSILQKGISVEVTQVDKQAADGQRNIFDKRR